MITQLLTYFKARWLPFILVGTIGLGAGAWLHSHFTQPSTTSLIVNGTPQVKVESPTLNPTIIDHVVTDPKQQEVINDLLKENHVLKLKTTVVNSSVATNKETGGTSTGGVIVQDAPVGGTPNGVNTQPTPDHEAARTFTDFQLDATYSSESFSYSLTQKFRIVESLGKDKAGNQVGQVKLFQDTPKGEVEIPTQTTVIFADTGLPHFLVSPRIQAGVGYTGSKGGIVAFQWLKHGRSTATEDTRWAYLSPAWFITGATTGKGVLLPVSFNFGTINHSPFTNVWLSPTVDIHKAIGVVLTATF